MKAAYLCLWVLLTAAPFTAIGADDPNIELVRSFYASFAADLVGGKTSSPQEVDTYDSTDDARFFTAELARLLARDNACVQQTGEPCNLDFDPFWDSQDPSAVDLRIGKGRRPGEVVVTYRNSHARTQVTRLRYLLERTPQGPRIADICYTHGGCLRRLLQQP